MKTLLIKLGGSIITDEEYRQTILKQLIELIDLGYKISIVHGGGKLISHYLERLSIKTEFIDGLRYTSPEILDIVMMTLIGKVNKDIVLDFKKLGVTAFGISSGDGDLIECSQKQPENGVDLGFIGEPKKFNFELYNKLVGLGYPLVIATVGIAKDSFYNINADFTAAYIAKEAKVDHLIYVSDVNGVLNLETKETYSKLNRAKILELKHAQIITEGMLPKLNSCLSALEGGVSRVSILSGKIYNSILDCATDKNISGTEIKL